MKKLIFIFLFLAFGFTSDVFAYDTVVPFELPYTYQGVTFNNLACSINNLNGYGSCFYSPENATMELKYIHIDGYPDSAGIKISVIPANTGFDFIQCTISPEGELQSNCYQLNNVAYGAVSSSLFDLEGAKYTVPIYNDYIPDNTELLYQTNYGNIPPTQNSIIFPGYDSFVPVGETIISGTCVNVGTNLKIVSQQITDIQEFYSPDITCASDFTWETSRNTYSGGNLIYLYDFSNQEWTEHYYHGYNSESLIWSLGLQYPQLDSQNTAKVEISDNFPFRAKYTIESADFNNVEIHLDKCTLSNYTNCETEILNNTLPYFDEDKTGYFEFTLDTTSDYQYYDFYIVYDSIIQYTLKFRVLGSTDTDSQLSVLPDKKDLGYWGNTIRDFIMPPFGYFDVKLNSLKDIFYERFSFIEQIRTSINSRASMPSSSEFISPTIYFMGESYSVIGNGTLDTLLPTIRNILSGIIYFMLSIFVIRSVSKIINT